MENNGSRMLSNKSNVHFREIALQLWQQQQASPFKLLLITSSFKGEGKSFVSSYLADAFALKGSNVLVIRYDGYNPAGKIKTGNTWEDAIRRDAPPDFSSLSPNGVFQLTLFSEKKIENTKLFITHFEDLIRRAEDRFDLILLDFPHINDEFFPFELLDRVEKILMIIRANHTQKRAVIESLKIFGGYRDRLAGLVLNKRKEYVPKLFLRALE